MTVTEVMMEKVQEKQKKRKDPTCCYRSGYRQRPCCSDVFPAMPVV